MREPLVATAGPWYHGSPHRLTVLKKGASVSPYVEIASGFAHKPPTLHISVDEGNEEMELVVTHNGQQPGYLYRVDVADPRVDLELHPEATDPPKNWEMVAQRDLPLEFIRELPLGQEYRGRYRMVEQTGTDSAGKTGG